MRIGVSSYSFHAMVRSGKLTQLSMIQTAAELGFDEIEFTDLQVPAGETPESFAKQLRGEGERCGIAMGNYTVTADLLNGSNGDLQAEVERLKGQVDLAQILGAKGMRHDATFGFKKDAVGSKSFEAALPRLIQGSRTVTEYAETLGIRTMVENHGFFAQDSERVEKLVCGVNHPNFGLLIDIGNFLCVDEDPCEAVGRVAAYAFHVHVKDFHVKPGNQPDPGKGWFSSRGGNYLRGAIIGHGEVQVGQCLRILKKSGYQGSVSVEFEGIEDSITGISIGLENLRRYLL